MKRRRMTNRKSRRLFSKTASRTNKRNLIDSSPKRGGIRL